MKAREILQQEFKDEFGEDWQIELRNFEHGEPAFHGCTMNAIRKALNMADIRNQRELFENMQYYMEFCQMKGYITPQVWIEKHKHF